jgi:hypothetical protein
MAQPGEDPALCNLDPDFDLGFGQSRRLRLMTRLRSESSASPIPFIH